MTRAPFPPVYCPLAESPPEIADMVLRSDLWPHVPSAATDEDNLAMIEPMES
jgi:hypothetical protein